MHSICQLSNKYRILKLGEDLTNVTQTPEGENFLTTERNSIYEKKDPKTVERTKTANAQELQSFLRIKIQNLE